MDTATFDSGITHADVAPLHEAAHCVVCLGLGLGVGWVRVDGNGDGEVAHAKPETPMQQAAISIAGWVAERREWPYLSADDVRNACHGDFQKFDAAIRSEIHQRGKATTRQNLAYIADLARQDARDILARNWKFVKALAAALKRHGRLDHHQIDALFAAVP